MKKMTLTLALLLSSLALVSCQSSRDEEGAPRCNTLPTPHDDCGCSCGCGCGPQKGKNS